MPRARSLRPFLAPTLVGAALRVGVAALPLDARWDGAIYLRGARLIAAGSSYSLRILSESAPPTPTAFYPVGYPALLAPLVALGLELRGLLVAQAFFTALVVPLSGLLARRMAGREAGRAAAWLAALWPGGVLWSAALLGEGVFAVLLGVLLVALAYARRGARTSRAALASVALGGLALVRPVALLVAAAVGAWAAASKARITAAPKPARWPRALVGACVAGMLAAIPLAPWAARNERALGAAVPLATNGGLNLLLGTVGVGAFGPLPAALDCPRELDEVAKDRCRGRAALTRIREAPAAWLARGVAKLANTFGHETAPAHHLEAALRAPPRVRRLVGGIALGLSEAGWALVLGLAALGARRARAGPGRAMVFLPLAATALLHGVVLGGDRYHAAVAPAFLALAGVGARAFARRA